MRCPVCFDQPELTEAIDIVGAPEVLAQAAPDRPQANIAVRLCDVHPDGASELISYGVLNLTHRDSHEFPEALVPGKTVSARVVLDQCAYRVPAGHHLRVAVSNAYWPMIRPSPERVQLDLSAATLMLPLRPLAKGAEISFPAPEGATPQATETIRAASSERHVDRDETPESSRFPSSTTSANCAIRARPRPWQHCPRDLGDPSRQSPVSIGQDALDTDPVAKWMVGADRDVGGDAIGRAKLHPQRQNRSL